MIEENGIYESADPRDNGRQIRVVSYTPGHNKADIVSHPKGDRRRRVEASTLHESAETKAGVRRRTGYFLVGTSSPLQDRARQSMDPATRAELLNTLAAEEPLTGRAKD